MPAPMIFDYMCGGGGYWDEKPRGFLEELVRRKTCPVLQKGRHITEQSARKFVNAMQWGGLSTPEAWEVFRLHDCTRYGEAELFEVQDTADLPDRWFRDAWRRSSNGGPPSVDLEKARPIQWRRLMDAVSRENKRREFDLFGQAPIKLNKIEYQTAIKHARDDSELRRIFPAELIEYMSTR